MTKFEFLQRLESSLAALSESERQEIIQDFEEHFAAGLDMGKTQAQICEELGNPEDCAAPYLTSAAEKPQQESSDENNGCQPQTDINGKKVNTVSYAQPAADRAPPVNSRSRFLWKIVFILFLIAAISVYPASLALMLSPIAIGLAAAVALAVVSSPMLILFFVSLSVTLFCIGLLMFLIMSALLRLSFRKSGF